MKNDNLKSRINKSLANGFKFLFVILIFSFLLFNLLASQNISPLYFQTVKEDKKAVIVFLEKIKDFSPFPFFLEMNRQIYGDEIEQAVFSKEAKRKQTINNLELFLQKNPKSGDILYQLSILYREDGNSAKAGEYLKRAKEIDPLIISNDQIPSIPNKIQ